MARCIHCDYSRDGNSLYHEGLAVRHSSTKRLVWNDLSLGYECSDCLTKNWGFPTEQLDVFISREKEDVESD